MNKEQRPKQQYFQALVQEIVAGNKDRFEEIVYLYGNQIFGYALRLTQNYEDSLDIMQEVLMRVYRSLSGWKARASFSTWLYRIIYNVSMDYLRNQSKWKKVDVENPAILATDELSDPRMELERRRVRKDLARAMLRIPKRQRQCFLLRYYLGLDVGEIAKAEGLAEGTVKQHLFRARHNLRKELKQLFQQ